MLVLHLVPFRLYCFAFVLELGRCGNNFCCRYQQRVWPCKQQVETGAMQTSKCLGQCRFALLQPPVNIKAAAFISKAPRAARSSSAVAMAAPARLGERHLQKQQQRDDSERLKHAAPLKKKEKSAAPRSSPAQKQSRKQRRAAISELTKRIAFPEGAELDRLQWRTYETADSSSFLEYIPGRDHLYSAEQLAAGLTAFDAATGDHILQTRALPKGVLKLVSPFALRGVQLFTEKQLPYVTDGRASGGLIDVAAYLEQPDVQQQVEDALHSRAGRLKAAGLSVPKKAQMLPHVVHVSPDGRKVYIGDEHDVTRNGTRLMTLPKAWKGNRLQTWVGGKRISVPVEGQPPRLEPSHLSTLLAAEEGRLISAAERIWDMFAADPTTADAATRMLAHIRGSKIRQQSALGRTGWNGYVFNVSFRTGPHVDGKNVAGSYSALVVAEIGDPVAGGFYMLPQYRAALDLRQGVVMFHRSDERRLGLHGNSGMHIPHHQSHRVALVFYQTDLKVEDDAPADETVDTDA